MMGGKDLECVVYREKATRDRAYHSYVDMSGLVLSLYQLQSSDAECDSDYDYDIGPPFGAFKPFEIHKAVQRVQEKYVPSERDR